MESPLMRELVLISMRFKRVDLCPMSLSGMPASELAVMLRAANCGCREQESESCVSDIQDSLHISKPAVSQTLNNLERKGYITRNIDANDRRKIKVTITAAGCRQLDEAQRAYESALDEILTKLGTAEARTLITLLNRLMDILENER